MPTQEERLTTLERTMTEYRPVLRDIVYELAIVKGITTDQVKITQELTQNAIDTNKHLEIIDKRIERLEIKFEGLEEKFDEQKTLLKEHTAILIQILEHLKTP